LADTYHTISAPSIGVYKDRGSKFIAYAFPADSEAEWQERLEEIRQLEPKARHHCFAFRIGPDGAQYRANDDGEPAGSAGRPILGQIDSFGLTNVIVIVARYFGGTLLGVPGLIAAYKESTREALQAAESVEKTVRDYYRIRIDYALMNNAMGAAKKLGFDVRETVFSDVDVAMETAVASSEAAGKIIKFKAITAGLHLEAVEAMETVPGIEIEYLYTR